MTATRSEFADLKPPCTQGYDHPAEGWLVSPGGLRVRPLCARCADQRLVALNVQGLQPWWFEPV